ncbi:MAG: UbiD family decarboxylase [Candidatus Bathyarchaeia archaeon]|jgi:UbiD family decarboxylase
MRDLRTYLKRLERELPDQLVRVSEPVSHEYDVTRRVEKAAHTRGNPALLFERVKGFKEPLLVNVFGHVDRIKLALEGTPRPVATRPDMYREWGALMSGSIEPVNVPKGPVKEIKLTGSEVDLTRLPILRYYKEDAGRYITSGLVAARDPEKPEVVNLSYARMQLKGRSRIGTTLHSRGNLWSYFEKAKASERPLEIAVVIGAHPALYLAAAAKITGEYAVAGSLIGEPMRLVVSETVDVPVPADAEMVIEGRITLEEEDEGPFTEYTGYLSGRSTRNVFEVSCVTMRNDAIYQTIMPSNSDEHLLLSGLPKQARIYSAVSAFTPMPAVRDMSWPVSGTHYICFISMETGARTIPGLAKQVGLLVLGLDPYLKLVVLLPENIDVGDLGASLGAMAERCDMTLGSGVEMLRGVFCHRLDPSSSTDGTASKAIVDATGQPRKIPVAYFDEERGMRDLGVAEVLYPLGDNRLRVLKMAADSNAKLTLIKSMDGPGLTICVDSDIDASDLRQVVWGIATRFQPADDVVLQCGGMGIDGTKPPGWKARRASVPFG